MKGDFKIHQEVILCDFNKTNKDQILRNISVGVISCKGDYDSVEFSESELINN